MGKYLKYFQRLSLVVIAIIFISPILWVISSSFKPADEIFLKPPEFLPKSFTLNNYIEAVKTIPFFTFLKNTILISSISTIGVVISSVTPAYALARMKFRGRNLLFLILLATMFLPYPAVMIPTYLIFAKLHWTGTFLPLLVPAFFGDAFSIFLLRQFFIRLPQDLLEASRLDGASEWQIITHIIFPLSRAAIATVAVLNFAFMWADFLRPLLYLNETRLYTLSIGIQNYQAHHQTSWHLVLAATVIFIAPIFLLFWFAQRAFISGLTLGGVKDE